MFVKSGERQRELVGGDGEIKERKESGESGP